MTNQPTKSSPQGEPPQADSPHGSYPKDLFAQALMDAIWKTDSSFVFEYDKDPFTLKIQKNDIPEGEINLSNIYQAYFGKSKGEQKAVIDRVVRAFNNRLLPEDFNKAGSYLLPKVFGRASLAGRLVSYNQLFDPPPETVPHEIIAEDLALILVYYKKDAAVSVTNAHLKKWGKTFGQALETALANLNNLKPSQAEVEKGVYVSVTHDQADATRLMLAEFIRKLPLKGSPVALVPTRNILIVTGSEDNEGLKTALGLAEKAHKLEKYPNSGWAFILQGDVWTRWALPKDNELYNGLMDFERAYRNMEYGQQQREIEAVLSEDKKNILVGDYKLAEDEQTKESYTFTFWSQGAELFLPKVDFVLFTDSSGKRLADWDSVEKHLGDLMKPLFLYPPRYFVKGFPTPGQFKKMERAILRENNN